MYIELLQKLVICMYKIDPFDSFKHECWNLWVLVGTSITKRCFCRHWSLQLLLRSDVLGLPALAQIRNCWCGTSENQIWKRKNAKIELWFFGLVHPCEYLHQTWFCTNEIYQFISYEYNYCARVIKRELLFFIWNQNEWAWRPRINYFAVINVFFLVSATTRWQPPTKT